MANSHSPAKNKNAWKYLSFVLMGILAIGVTIPQASAAAAGGVPDLLQQILNIVKSPLFGNQAIMDAINGLQGTAATDESVKSLQDSIDDLEEKVDALAENNGAFQIVRAGTVYAPEDGIIDRMECVSDHDYKLYLNVKNDPSASSDAIDITSNSFSHTYFPDQGDFSYVVGGLAGETLTIQARTPGDLGILAHITMETAEGADASCTRI